MYRLLIVSFIFIFSPLSVYAQGSNAFLGYSYLNADGFSNRNHFNGWNASLEGKMFPFIGIVADLSGHYGHETLGLGCGSSCSGFTATSKQYNFVFGPRISVGVGKFVPFAHYLLGASHITTSGNSASASDTSFSQAVGGGVDIKALPIIGWRFQGDYLQTRFFDLTQNDFRFSTGIVLHF